LLAFIADTKFELPLPSLVHDKFSSKGDTAQVLAALQKAPANDEDMQTNMLQIFVYCANSYFHKKGSPLQPSSTVHCQSWLMVMYLMSLNVRLCWFALGCV
jgi:hypothetical protein